MNEPRKVPISKRIVLINSISGIVTRILTVGVFAWVIQYLLKRVPEEEMAVFGLVSALAMILPLLQTILTGGLARFVTEAYARHDLAGVTRIVSSQFPLMLGGALLMLAFGGTVAWNIANILNISPEFVGKARTMMLLIVVRMAIGMSIVPFNSGIYANQKFIIQNFIDIGSSLLRMALMLLFVLGFGPNVVWVTVANVASQLVGQITTTVISVRLLPALKFRPSQFDWTTSKRVLSFSGWNFVGESANLIRRATDIPILNLFALPDGRALAVNDFYLGSLFDTQLRSLTIVAGQPLMPALTAMHAHDQQERLASAFLRGGRIALWVAMFLAVPAIVFSHDLFALYLGEKYATHANAATVMAILLLTLPFSYPTAMLYRIAYARGEIRPLAIRALASQAGNLLLTLIFVGWFKMGAVGSAVATFMSFAIADPFLNWPLAMRTLQLSWRRFISHTLIPGLFPATLAAIVGLVCTLLGDSSLVRAMVGIPICLGAYAIGVLLSLKGADRSDILRILRLIRSKQTTLS
jgi:O-antigen/teichoic acid export membrane protein